MENIMNPPATLKNPKTAFNYPSSLVPQFFFGSSFLALLQMPNFNTCLILSFFCSLYISVVFTNKNSASLG